MLNFSQNAQGVYVWRGVVFWPVSSLSNATVTLIPRILLLQHPLEEAI